MSARHVAKRVTTAANTLLAASLFMALIWFTACVVLFVVCLLLYGAAWLIDDDAVAALRVPTTPE